MKLSVILPTLDKVATALCLASRVREVLSGLELEVVIITPAPEQREAPSYIRFVQDRGGGVYAAYSQGLRHARGDYVWLIGDDDYPLDSAASIRTLLEAGEVDLIVAPVLFSSGRVYKPFRSRFLLLFFNWCQQGVIYRRSALLRHRFYRRLKIQADHYVNILLRADRSVRTVFLRDPICVFSVHGVSSRNKDLRFRALRPMLARRTLGCSGYLFFEAIVRIMSVRRWYARRRA